MHERSQSGAQDSVEDAGIELLQGPVIFHLIGQIEVGERPGMGIQGFPGRILLGDAVQEPVQLSAIIRPTLSH